MKIFLANPRGMCAGVERAINIANNSLKIYGPPIYIHHELVHNKYVVDCLKQKGMIFVENIKNVPKNSILIFSAHGVSKRVQKLAQERYLTILDATCPLVKKVHHEVSKSSLRGKEVILIGHKNHPEVIGTLGQYENKKGKIYLIESLKDVQKLKVKNVDNLCFTTQTTLSIEETSKIILKLKKRFPKIHGPHKQDICFATENRQNAVKLLIKFVDIMLVVGSKNSSNSNRLLELAKKSKKPAYLIDNNQDLNIFWFKNVKKIGITSGASAPEILTEQIISHLKHVFNFSISIYNVPGKKENVTFSVPKELQI
ncbi:1-hydroxy-2-methyl-2-(E)-butenyl 4-diphosphate reductase, 4Fe-4S protein [Wigglesworthia glossinidia endosymbiont of Glossina morsitans morsitans (Yale colony)]|uniref:4-hydroxy-3-methylbut-2-enyl diphosphate reductase n=1 Tax=Wigglesworthia glossinidia endosymbiont of Glossina morsitans morsitans (Yale colony) TaxID=1142511 RepID=H6Q525_WIGGL|nr:4-hydroxy-3-methylbut-2-enyl diphosphate reductase [Wigglesworthia glossinidia]AFA41308.1 1-hydroxy-2-methyl-2-(E)-butenyl 4-diphosphate reductase, 4Fe-4S protein [Wigglesworthia glossinidia endosymbiont of Glossina morsitans morsitans (Yale colony)]